MKPVILQETRQRIEDDTENFVVLLTEMSVNEWEKFGRPMREAVIGGSFDDALSLLSNYCPGWVWGRDEEFYMWIGPHDDTTLIYRSPSATDSPAKALALCVIDAMIDSET